MDFSREEEMEPALLSCSEPIEETFVLSPAPEAEAAA